MTASNIPPTASRTSLAPEIQKLLNDHRTLYLGGEEDFHAERRHHIEVFGLHALPRDKIRPIGEIEFTAIRGPHWTIPLGVLCPRSAPKSGNDQAALIYFHGGGYTVGFVDDFEIGLRLLAEESGVQVYAAEYRPSARVSVSHAARRVCCHY
jgi:acetyl esterase/lipase